MPQDKSWSGWQGPVVVGNHKYRFAPGPKKCDGTTLWPVSVAMATELALNPVQRSCVDVGCGYGLIGMVTGGTLIEHDSVVIPVLRKTLTLNDSDCELIEQDWREVSGAWDCIYGSEVAYDSYKGLVGFIDCCWTRKGDCLFGMSLARRMGAQFERELTERKIAFVYETKQFGELQYGLWRLNGGR